MSYPMLPGNAEGQADRRIKYGHNGEKSRQFGKNVADGFFAALNDIAYINPVHSIKDIADDIPDNDSTDCKAIPSGIAHVLHTETQIRKYLSGEISDPECYNQWLGLICAIAFRADYGLNIQAHNISLNTNNKKTLDYVLYKDLINYSKITHWKPADTSLTVYTINNNIFAMMIPGLLVCPFAQYNKADFRNLPWFDAQNDKWLDPMINLSDADKNSFIAYMQRHRSFTDQFSVAVSSVYESKFPANLNFNNGIVLLNNTNTSLESSIFELATDNNLPDRFVNEKMLLIGFYKGDGAPFNIDLGPDTLTPKMVNIQGVEANKEFYVIPPIHADCISKMQDTTNPLILVSWSAEAVQNGINCTFCFKDSGNKEYFRSFFYGKDNIYYTSKFPYISMWPYVADANNLANTWNEYFIAVNKNSSSTEATIDLDINLPVSDIVSSDGNIGENLTIDVIAASQKKYEVTTGYKPRVLGVGDSETFEMHRTTDFPYAIKIRSKASEPVEFGCWGFCKKHATQLPAPAPGNDYVVSLDLGSTATQLRMKKNASGESATKIKAPGNFIFEMHNPYHSGIDNGEAKRDAIQAFILFGKETGELNKIYSFQQNHIAKFGNNPIMNTIIPYVTGRATIVDGNFMSAYASENNSTVTGINTIRGDLKWDPDNAPDSFVSTVLTWGLLSARLAGAAAVTFMLSYPKQGRGNVVVSCFNKISNDLQAKSGLTTVRCGNNLTEAQANGLTFTEAIPLNAAGANLGNFNQGFLVVDIGGGTTDIALLQGKDKDEALGALSGDRNLSIRYAGREIINYSFIAGKDMAESYKEIWDMSNNNPVAVEIAKGFRNCYASLENIHNNPRFVSENPEINKQIKLYNYFIDAFSLSADYINATDDKLLTMMSLKYISLFVFIGRYLKKINYNFGASFKIFLAGCCSKGLTTFLNNFNIGNMLTEALKTALLLGYCTENGSFDEDLYNSVINTIFELPVPIYSDKEEVSIGLTYESQAANITGNRGRAIGDAFKIQSKPDGAKSENSSDDKKESDNAEKEVKKELNYAELADNFRTYVICVEQAAKIIYDNFDLSVYKLIADDSTERLFAYTNEIIHKFKSTTSVNMRENLKTNNYVDDKFFDEFFNLYAFEAMLDTFSWDSNEN